MLMPASPAIANKTNRSIFRLGERLPGRRGSLSEGGGDLGVGGIVLGTPNLSLVVTWLTRSAVDTLVESGEGGLSMVGTRVAVAPRPRELPF